LIRAAGGKSDPDCLKYTHARIGGFIKGEYQRCTKKRGVRCKGGASLRDKLYSMKTKKELKGRATNKPKIRSISKTKKDAKGKVTSKTLKTDAKGKGNTAIKSRKGKKRKHRHQIPQRQEVITSGVVGTSSCRNHFVCVQKI
jgi:hypothetical protein